MNKQIETLSDAELLKAMIYNASVTKHNSIIAYYKKMDPIDLRLKAYHMYGETINVPVAGKAERVPAWRKTPHKPSKPVLPIAKVTSHVESDITQDAVDAVMFYARPWVKTVTIIDDRMVGVILKDDRYYKNLLEAINRIDMPDVHMYVTTAVGDSNG